MSQVTNVRDLLIRGRAAARAGDKQEAVFYLKWALRSEADQEQRVEALYWLSEVTDEPAVYLHQVLAHNPYHPEARRKLAMLEGRLRPADLVDPNQLPPIVDQTPSGSKRFHCPQCAAPMVYTPDGRSLVCEHCGYQQLPDSAPAGAEQDFILSMATAQGHTRPVDTPTFACSNCAAQFSLVAPTLSLTCPYCHAVHVLENRPTRQLIPPQRIIPFAISEAQAHKMVLSWLKKQDIRAEVSVYGLYQPAWLFDLVGQMAWRGWHEGRDEWVSGTSPIWVSNVLVPAGRTLPLPLQKVNQTYDLDHLVGYAPHYLAGWPAENYTIPMADASLQARKAGWQRLHRQFQAGNPELSRLQWSPAGMVVESFQLALLPLWLAHIPPYQIAINGQTGLMQTTT